MESSVPGVYGLVNRALVRLRIAVLGEALAAPAAGFLLVTAALLAAARATGRLDLPRGVIAATAALASLAALAKLARHFPSFEDAALHLDRSLAAGERFTTVVETADRDPALAEWAARGALERATGEGLRAALALRPPAALLPLLLAATVVAGLALLPAPPATAAGSARIGATAGLGAGTDGADRMQAPGAASSKEPARGESARAPDAASPPEPKQAPAASVAASPPVRKGDDAAGQGAGGGAMEASADGTPREVRESFRPLPVPLRAREAVRNYFGAPRTAEKPR